MKCANNHEVPEGSKFCGDCGSPAAETLQKAVCTSCSAEGLSSQKFCAECAEPMAKSAEAAEAEYVEALGALDQLAQGANTLDDEVMIATTLAKSEDYDTGEPGAELSDIEVNEMVGALLKANNTIVDFQTEIGRGVMATRREVGILAKAYATIARSQKARTDELLKAFDTFGNAPKGPKARTVATIAKEVGPEAQAAEDESPKGQVLLAKCRAAMQSEKLEPNLLIKAESYVNHFPGISLSTIIANEPEFGMALHTAIGAVTQ